MRSTKRAGLAVVLLLAAGCAGAWAEPEDTAAVAKPAEPAIDPAINLEEYPMIVDQRDVGPFCLRIRQRSEPEPDNNEPIIWQRVLEIRKEIETGDKLVYLRKEQMASFPKEITEPFDMNEDGVSNVVVETYTGGAHCCHEYVLLELGDPVTVVARLDFSDFRIDESSLDYREGTLHVEYPDMAFYWWWSWATGGRRPYYVDAVLLADGLHMDTDKIKREEPDIMGWVGGIKQVWSDKDFCSDVTLSSTEMKTPVPLFETMQELCYNGHGEYAWKLLDRVWPRERLDLQVDVYKGKRDWTLPERYWPADAPGKEEYLMLFREHLRTSTFWRDICALNKWNLDAWKEAEK